MRKLLAILLICIPSLIFSVQDFVYLSAPKCGTHLLANLIQNVTGLNLVNQAEINETNFNAAKKNNLFLFNHQMSDEEVGFLVSKNVKVIFIYRDPRDQIISLIYWFMKVIPNHPLSQIQDMNKQIEVCITGDIELNIKPVYEAYFEKIYHQVDNIPKELVYKVRFEDVVGSKGGGSDETQLSHIIQIASFLDIPFSITNACKVQNKIWGLPGTFRKGIIGDWKNHFTPEHIQLYKAKYGHILIELGYEKDLNW